MTLNFLLIFLQCKMYWQNKGDYLCVVVDRYTKSKKVYNAKKLERCFSF